MPTTTTENWGSCCCKKEQDKLKITSVRGKIIITAKLEFTISTGNTYICEFWNVSGSWSAVFYSDDTTVYSFVGSMPSFQKTYEGLEGLNIPNPLIIDAKNFYINRTDVIDEHKVWQFNGAEIPVVEPESTDPESWGANLEWDINWVNVKYETEINWTEGNNEFWTPIG